MGRLSWVAQVMKKKRKTLFLAKLIDIRGFKRQVHFYVYFVILNNCFNLLIYLIELNFIHTLIS